MMKADWVYRRGDIYFANLDPVVGSEQGGYRPVVVVQNDIGNKHSPTIIVVTVTSKVKKKANMPTHFLFRNNPSFRKASMVQMEHIYTIDKSKIDQYLGKATEKEMRAIDKGLVVSLALDYLFRRKSRSRNNHQEKNQGVSKYV